MKTREQRAADIYSNGRDCVMKGGNSLRSLARHIKTVVFGNEEMEGPLWRARQWPDQTITLDRFEDYLLKPAREGLGIPDFAWLLDVLQAHPEKSERDDAIKAVIHEIPDFIDRAEVIKRKREVKEATRQTDPTSKEFVDPAGAAVKGKGKRLSNTEPLSQSEMNSKPGTLRRLARSHPDLLARVESGELSAHAAAVQAGIRKPMKSIPIDTPDAAIRALLRVFTVTDLAQALGRASDDQAES
jgi:hypothetical protein